MLSATEFNPWFGNLFEANLRTSYIYQHYHQISSEDGSFSHSGNNHFLDISLEISPWPDWDAEVEITYADTSDHGFGFEKFTATGRYLFLDDIVCDPVTLAAGFSLSFVNHHFLHDFGIQEHGECELELHVAIGKEIPECYADTWAYHYWAALGIGQSNRGSPWIFSRAEWDINYCDRSEVGVYTYLLFGLGGRDIQDDEPFKGYADVQHQSIDLGAFYRYYLWDLGAITLDYNYRPFAHNFPEHAHTVKATLLFVFSPL